MSMRGNALLNRLRSHRAATILYRTSSQPERERVSRPLAPVGATAAAKRPVVMARLIPTGSSLPFGQVIAPERVSPAIQRETEQIFPVESFERGDFASPRRVPYQQQPTLPSTEIEPKAADIPAAPTPELPQVKPPQPPVPSRAAAPEMPGGQTSSDAPSVQEEPSPTAKPKPKVTPPPGASEDFSWISDGEWNRLKRFMEGHEEQLAQQAESPEAIQRAEQERREKEARARAEAEVRRRQELAREGKLPKASVDYISPGEVGKSPSTLPVQRMPESTTPADSVADEEPIDPSAADVAPAAAESVPQPTVEASRDSLKSAPAKTTPALQRDSDKPAVIEPLPPDGERTTNVPSDRDEPPMPGPGESAPVDTPFVKPSPPSQVQTERAESVAKMERETSVEETSSQPDVARKPEREAEATQPDTIEAAEIEPLVPEEEVEDAPKEGGGLRRIFDAARSLFERDEPEPKVHAPVEPAETTPAAQPEQRPILQRELDTGLTPPAPPLETVPDALKPADITETSEPKIAAEDIEAERSRDDQVAQPPEAPSDAPEAGEKQTPQVESETPPPPGVKAEDQTQIGQAPQIARKMESQSPKAAPVLDPAPEVDAAPEPAAEHEVPELIAEQPIEVEPADEIDPGDAETLIQPVPLEAAWPVQEVKRPEPEEPSDRPADLPGPTVQRKPKGIDKDGEDVHSAIKDVAPEKPTDSSIELLTPRRPRPTRKVEVPAKADEQEPTVERPQEPPADLPKVESPPETTQGPEPALQPGDGPIATIQKAPDLTMPERSSAPLPQREIAEQPTKPEVGPVDDGPSGVPVEKHYDTAPEAKTSGRKELPATKPPPPMPTLQREGAAPVTTKTAAPATKTAEPYMVPTEIGDLPSDLWTLLGEQPPPQVTRKTPVRADTADGAVQRKANGHPAQMVTEVFRAPEIQRVEEAPVTRTETEASTTESGGEEDDNKQGKVDVDKLAQQVYAEIKRRLQIDWERGRFN